MGEPDYFASPRNLARFAEDRDSPRLGPAAPYITGTYILRVGGRTRLPAPLGLSVPVEGHKVDSRYAPSSRGGGRSGRRMPRREVDFQRLSRSKIRLRPFRERILAEGRARDYARDPVSPRLDRNNSSAPALAKSIRHRALSV